MAHCSFQHGPARPDYPYGARPLRPQWRKRSARGLAGLIAAAAALSLHLHGGVWPPDQIALLILLPAMAGITLAFAPDPPSFVSRLAKRLTTAGCAAGTLAGPWLAPMILCVPALLALSVGVGWLAGERDHG
jgi:hypothetical protein